MLLAACIIAFMKDAYPLEDFDDWAPTYDQDVAAQGFPFAGYEHTLDEIVKAAKVKNGMHILDLGAGTGNLTFRFLEAGSTVIGVDYSSEMLKIARAKCPAAAFRQADLRSDPSSYLKGEKFDRIVSAYTFDHFTLAKKYQVLKRLAPFLKNNGFFVVGDIAFLDSTALKAVKESSLDEWEDEDYWLADQSIGYLTQKQLQTSFTQTGMFSGVFSIKVIH